jgi:hypothetical protein
MKTYFSLNLKYLVFLLIFIENSGALFAQKNSLNQWNYIQVDSMRQKWGDFSEPEWLRYFGLDAKDINKDGYLDLVSGRYFYMNPGGNMEAKWKRSDLGMNVDGYLFADVDGDENADVIALALPNVYWCEVDNWDGTSWTMRKIGELPKTGHTNSQGYRKVQLLEGTKKQLLFAVEGGIHACTIPENPLLAKNWEFFKIIPTDSDEGIGIGDIDGDGDIDIACGDIEKGQKEMPTLVNWHENPGSIAKVWKKHSVGKTIKAADRFEIADINGDGKADIIVSEEMYPGLEPEANIFVYTNPGNPNTENWARKSIITTWSVNNLDVADLDNDGDNDIVSNEHKGTDYRRLIFENDGKGNFTMFSPDKGHESHLGSQLFDLDSDGDLDMVSIAWDHHQYLHVWRNDAIKKEYTWKHLSTITGEIPQTAGGKQQTSCLTADLDNDGAAEIVITDRSVTPSVIMYTFKNGKFVKSVIDNDPLKIEAGNAYMDIDNDGDVDIIFPGEGQSNQIWWWENPFPAKDGKPWKRRTIKNSGENKHHDLIVGDFDGDGKEELVFWNQGGNLLAMAEVPANPKTAKEWDWKPIYTYSNDSEMEPAIGLENYPSFRGTNEHEGLAKADIDGDGIMDIIGGGRWFKYTKDGTFVPNMIEAAYIFTRCAAGQLIEGGRPEIILSAGDGYGPMNLYQWVEKYDDWHKKWTGTGAWVKTQIIETLYDGHSIDIIDLNGDGHLDIFSAEMRLNPNNPGTIRILLGDGKGNFKIHVVQEDIGCHEGKIIDLDGDGDYDIVSKPYNWDAPRLDVFINTTKK